MKKLICEIKPPRKNKPNDRVQIAGYKGGRIKRCLK